MKSLSDHSASLLAWRRGEAGPPDFELQAEGQCFATLAFLDATHDFARVETAEGTWTLKRVGLLAPVVTLREEDSAANLAVFHPHAFRHGRLAFADGAVFDWVWRHEGGLGGSFLDPAGTPLVRLQTWPCEGVGPAIPGRCDVDLNPATAPFRHALLAAFGWFLILLEAGKAQDTAAAEVALRL